MAFAGDCLAAVPVAVLLHDWAAATAAGDVAQAVESVQRLRVAEAVVVVAQAAV